VVTKNIDVWLLLIDSSSLEDLTKFVCFFVIHIQGLIPNQKKEKL
jgi:hypothetical protein